MAIDSSATQQGESLITAKDRIQIGPAPGWVESRPFRIDFKAKEPGHVTYLLIDRQIHTELRQTYFHVALRLDTMQAVQNESPWRLDFEPLHQYITLHSIKTWRGGAQFDHASLSSARVVDRQAAGSVLQDRLSLLLMLEDLRPGDILEWCYTVESRPLLLAEHCAAMFTLPAGAAIGQFYFSLLFNPSRPMQWESSVPEWLPVESQDKDGLRWIWTRDNYPGLPPEENMPDWHIAHPWIQVSDCRDWGMIATAFSQAWQEDEDDPTVRKIAGELAAGPGGILEQTERAIQMVQDEYRYLASDWELDGHPPMPPGVVARRRYGDCKDLSFLLAHLLKSLGVPARLVLVNTNLRKSIAELLPAPGLFNHLLVEYEAGGETRWVDAAPNRQGGGSLKRAISDYGAGLPMSGPASHLVEPPGVPARNSVYDLKETILLDTTGAWSWLGVVVAARGSHAGALRQELASEGLEAFSKKRLRLYAERFTRARRVGALQYRDDRAANEFFLAEIFEIKDFLTVDPKSKWYKLELANDYIGSFLKTPDSGSRRAPLALPYPCNIVHTINLHSVSLPPGVVQQRGLETDYLIFNRLRKTLAGYWTMKLTLSTLADAVLPESLDEYRRTIWKIREESAWSLLVPAGDPRPHERGDFATLPASWDSNASIPAPSKPRPRLALGARTGRHQVAQMTLPVPQPDNSTPQKAAELPNVASSPSSYSQPSDTKLKRQKRIRRKRDTELSVGWHIVAACVMALTLILIVFLVARNTDHWSIFRKRPAAPPTPTPLNSLPVQ